MVAQDKLLCCLCILSLYWKSLFKAATKVVPKLGVKMEVGVGGIRLLSEKCKSMHVQLFYIAGNKLFLQYQDIKSLSDVKAPLQRLNSICPTYVM